MGLLDQVVGALAGGSNESGENPLLASVLQIINNPQTGGLSGLVQSFQQGGLGEVVNSWISTGQNLPISPDQLGSVLDPNTIQDVASRLGVSQEEASGQLAQWLPQVIDQLTPNGQVPSGNLAEQGMALLKGKLFGG